MPRQRNANRDKAFEIYKENKGNITNKEIANILGVSEKTISGWKSKDEWRLIGVFQTKIQSAPNENTKYSKQKITVKKEKDIDKKLLESVEENENLTDKQKLFCFYYIKNFNARLAAIKAGYSVKTATAIGYENLTKPHIKTEIKRLKELKRGSILISEDDIVERYMNIAFADISDFVNFGVQEIKVVNKQDIEEEYKRNYVTFKNSDIVDGGVICEISVGKNGSTIKLENRQKALDWLSKYFNMQPLDKHKIEYDNKRFELEQQKVNGSKSELSNEWIDVIIKNDGE